MKKCRKLTPADYAVTGGCGKMIEQERKRVCMIK